MTDQTTRRLEPYDHAEQAEIERRWQARWERDGLYTVDVQHVGAADKFYNLVEYPYPSAEGLHVGHVFTYAGADALGRYQRMRGKAVFQPIGFDSFGIHTENYALRVGEHPRTLTEKTTSHYREQLQRIGAGWDWTRVLATSDPAYYRWTQWIFVQLFRAGLAERREASVVWCPSCLTVLAFEQLEGDRCERCGTTVTRRVMQQWFLRITAYADRLLEGLDALDWPELSKRLQRDWIGRSEGAEVDFEVEGREITLSAFTTRPDTLYGVTFLALPPEHPHLDALVRDAGHEDEVRTFVERIAEERAVPQRGPVAGGRRGVFTGATAIHPATGDRIPIYVADYVVAEYGSGVVMGVPAHDERDHEFARATGIEVVPVIRPASAADAGEGAWTGEGILVDSGPFTSMDSARAREAIADWLEARGAGRRRVRYRLHDWLISRQRYWGPPIPIVYCDTCGTVPVPEEQLPVLLPEVEDFRPTGTGLSPLASVPSFVETDCPSCGGPARRETDVSDTFLDSAWYFLRYPSTDVGDRPWDQDRTARLLPVDQYAGGREHIVRHHLYARFVTMALHDLGLVPFAEPFPRIRLHGLLILRGAKMSKSRGNVVGPDEYVDVVGADVLRMYLLFCGPWEQGGEFSDAGLAGMQRFARRVWRLILEPHVPGRGGVDLRPLHRTVARVEADIEALALNTALAALMESARWASMEKSAMSGKEWEQTSRTLVRLLAPFAPHLAEELWSRLGEPYSVHRQTWPVHDPAALVEEEVTLVIQVNGRVRDRVRVPAGIDRAGALAVAMEREAVRRHLRDGKPKQVVFVPGRLINLVA